METRSTVQKNKAMTVPVNTAPAAGGRFVPKNTYKRTSGKASVLGKAVKTEAVRKRIVYTAYMLLMIRLLSQIPAPGINAEYFRSWIDAVTGSSGSAMSMLSSFTGGSFEKMSILSLSIAPYITASIVIQLLTFAVPRLEEISKDGEEGRKKTALYTRYATVFLAVVEALGLAITYGKQGLLKAYTPKYVILVTAVFATGALFTMWAGDRMTEKGIGNGISIILLVNIVSRIPQDLAGIYSLYIKGKNPGMALIAVIVAAGTAIFVTAATVKLNEGERRIPRQMSGKISGRHESRGVEQNLVLKVSTSGVMPVIFAMSIMQFPGVISQLFRYSGSGVWSRILTALNSGSWFNIHNFKYTAGYLLYAVLLFVFAYFYTSFQLNPSEIADSMKKSGATIPGIRPGRPTAEYLRKEIKYLTAIGALFLLGIATVPLVINGATGLSLSMGGTSIIIVVSVVIETYRQLESFVTARSIRTFVR